MQSILDTCIQGILHFCWTLHTLIIPSPLVFGQTCTQRQHIVFMTVVLCIIWKVSANLDLWRKIRFSCTWFGIDLFKCPSMIHIALNTFRTMHICTFISHNTFCSLSLNLIFNSISMFLSWFSYASKVKVLYLFTSAQDFQHYRITNFHLLL